MTISFELETPNGNKVRHNSAHPLFTHDDQVWVMDQAANDVSVRTTYGRDEWTRATVINGSAVIG